MSRKKIIFQGEPGANSHLACREAYPDYEPVPCPTFEDCFTALSAGEVDLGMIPIENSVAGRVADIHHLMPDSGLHIIAEWFLPIRNQLMAPKGASLDSIKSVESHVMALGQCRGIIRAMKLKPIVAADTAGSAREVAEANDVTRAAIASRLAAEISDPAELTNPNVVKAIGTPAGPARLHATTFTRADATGPGPHYHHIGLYAYRRAALARFVKLPPSSNEQRERLEQLRALDAGMRIDIALVDTVPLGVDTPEDLEKARRMLAG